MSYVRGLTELGIDYDPVTGLLTLKTPTSKALAYLERNFDPAGEGVWKPRTGVMRRISSAVKSFASGQGASDEVVAMRRFSCFGDKVAPACPALEVNERGSFCSACKCGEFPLADLEGNFAPKLRWSYLECPLKRPGFSNEVKS